MATTKALKIQQEDATKWDALSLEGSHHKEHKLKDMKYLKNECSTHIRDLTLRKLNHRLA
jgi:hypothetical protein